MLPLPVVGGSEQLPLPERRIDFGGRGRPEPVAVVDLNQEQAAATSDCDPPSTFRHRGPLATKFVAALAAAGGAAARAIGCGRRRRASDRPGRSAVPEADDTASGIAAKIPEQEVR